MIKRSARILSFTFLTLLAATTNFVSAQTVYNIYNDKIDQNGYDLIGTITTDGSIGTYTPTNFDISIKYGSATMIEYTSANAHFDNPLLITADGIYVQAGSYEWLALNWPSTYHYITWEPPVGPGGLYGEATDGNMDTTYWWAFNPPPSGYSAGTDWKIATAESVPEPSSWVLLGGGFGAMGVICRMRRCKRHSPTF